MCSVFNLICVFKMCSHMAECSLYLSCCFKHNWGERNKIKRRHVFYTTVKFMSAQEALSAECFFFNMTAFRSPLVWNLSSLETSEIKHQKNLNRQNLSRGWNSQRINNILSSKKWTMSLSPLIRLPEGSVVSKRITVENENTVECFV